MASVEERYAAATAYVRGAIKVVEDRGISYAVDPVTGIVEWYAGRTKTEQPRNEIARLEARWLRATTNDLRAQLAREAELLADRVQENLPGAPQDRLRTNLYVGEQQASTPATSYGQEVHQQAGAAFDWLKDSAAATASEAGRIGKWLLIGGSVVVGWKVIDLLRERERNRQRSADGLEDELDANLETAAEGNDAPIVRRVLR